ncbi:tetratricopeptide repeat protein [Desulfovibrio inopinatus]|uniref:tetratricopeptide repeat protein n=1 Tax=Desulfovibrio inopinatus TaxID=102109 RepID=UPI00040F2146|nr:tetratricopeptide repeat protein [Desulfovibrio inopinatus]
MISKVELYREVLAIEPHSRVFFSLAKILTETDALDEAIQVLKQGVTFHPDHLEAKLLLVELLSRQGREEEASENFALVARVLSQYPSIWQLWAKKTAAQSKDSSLAMAFLASYFQGQDFTWSEILEKGLASILSESTQDLTTSQSSSSMPVNTESEGEEEPSNEPEETSYELETMPLEEALHDDMSLVEAEEADVSEMSFSDSEETILDDVSLADDEEEEGPVDVNVAPVPHQPSAAPESLPLRGMDEVLRLTGGGGTTLEPADPQTAMTTDDDVEEDEDAHDEDEPDLEADPSAGHGIRTLTMADLLAKHGDLTGAIDIYQELLEKMPHGKAHDALLVKLDDLRRRAGLAASFDVLAEQQATLSAQNEEEPLMQPEEDAFALEEEPQTEEVEQPASPKPKLLGVLESLADRLEARSEA